MGELSAISEAQMEQLAEFDAGAFRRCLGEFVTGVTVITTVGRDGKAYGVTANSFSSVSLDPPLVLWSMRLNASTFPVYSEADFFGINILAEDQVEVSNRFAKSGPDRFEGVATTASSTGVPMIDGCLAQLECRREVNYPGGDHVVFICRVQRIRTSSRKPLALRSGKYMSIFSHEPSSFDEAAQSNIATLNAVHAARPVLEDLGRRTDRTVGLTVWGNHGPTLIWWWEASKPLATSLRCGKVVSMLNSSSGPLFAAYLPRELTHKMLEDELAQAQASGEKPSTWSELNALLREVCRTQLGCLVNFRSSVYTDRAVNAFASPVFNAAGEMILALTMMGDTQDFDIEDEAIAEMKTTALALSRKLGYRGD
jgi:flavin reductase (DIM6/NTAB) family NADH-FMN oxidoreductase RutF/DNA-binding IclR family transcriptional regulator